MIFLSTLLLEQETSILKQNSPFVVCFSEHTGVYRYEVNITSMKMQGLSPYILSLSCPKDPKIGIGYICMFTTLVPQYSFNNQAKYKNS